MIRQVLVLQLLLCLLASACAQPESDYSNTAASAENTASIADKLEVVSVPKVAGEVTVATKPSKPISLRPELNALVKLAKRDLATKLSISDQEIDMLQADFVTWRDASAGCPQPGMQYPQVLTNGARILLRANNATYQYHSGGKRTPFLCKNPSPIDPLPYAPGET